VCKIQKPIAEFHKRSDNSNYVGCCKKCRKKIDRQRYLKKQEETNGLYSVYRGMISRCYSKYHESFPMYGGREIKVCNEWRNNFKAFFNWANKNGYSKGLQLDRIDNEKGYCPENCRFVTITENMQNRRK
jgi:hypothetical protein